MNEDKTKLDMRNKTIFFSDIDGTLLRRENTVPQPVIEAAGRFMRAGGLLSLCTGRPLMSTEPIARGMGVNAPCIICGGAAVYDFAAGEYTYTYPCGGEILDCLDRLKARLPEVSIQVYTAAEIFMYHSTRFLEERGHREELAASRLPPFEIKDEVLKVLLTCGDAETLARCGDIIPADSFRFAFASRHFAEIISSGASKGKAASLLAERLNAPLSACFAAGDGHTDLPMLYAVGQSFAPSDAAEEVRAGASRVIPSANDCGMVEAFDYAADRI